MAKKKKKKRVWVDGYTRGPCKIKGFARDGAKVKKHTRRRRGLPRRPDDGIPF